MGETLREIGFGIVVVLLIAAVIMLHSLVISHIFGLWFFAIPKKKTVGTIMVPDPEYRTSVGLSVLGWGSTIITLFGWSYLAYNS